MSIAAHLFPCILLAGVLAQPLIAAAAEPVPDPDADALGLMSAPEDPSKPVPAAGQKTKVFVETALGAAGQRRPKETRTLLRGSLDINHSAALAPGWRATVSDRLDYIRPADFGADSAVNSLREAYVSWQREGGQTLAELGRVNLRSGPGYGYNPTDFFRDGSLRTITTLNPFSLRENRMGTVVLRGQQLWSGSALSLAYSPKLADHPSQNGASLDLGSTNNRDRGQVAFSHQLSERVNGQLLLNKESGLSPQVGANLTALVTDAAVAHAEWTRSREPDLLGRTQNLQQPEVTRNRFVSGLTYTTATKLSVTGEYQYNGFALDRAGWDRFRTVAPAALGGYLIEAQRRQELASRQAYFLYATQKNAGLQNLDVTALLRINAQDHSRLGWLEARYHWSSADLALQLQQQGGGTTTEYGLLPYRRSAQIVGVYYFK